MTLSASRPQQSGLQTTLTGQTWSPAVKSGGGGWSCLSLATSLMPHYDGRLIPDPMVSKAKHISSLGLKVCLSSCSIKIFKVLLEASALLSSTFL